MPENLWGMAIIQLHLTTTRPIHQTPLLTNISITKIPKSFLEQNPNVLAHRKLPLPRQTAGFSPLVYGGVPLEPLVEYYLMVG